MKNIVLILLVAAVVGFGESVFAVEYYMATDGSDATGDGSLENEWQTLQYSMAQMGGGDTLIIRDGVYKGGNNTIFPWNYPPSGSGGVGYTTIKAEHDGKVIFDGEGIRQLININGNGMNPQPSYLLFEGIIFRNSTGTTVGIVYANHIKILKCGMYDAEHDDGMSGSPLFFRYVDYALIEDTYLWGNGKYKFYMLDSDHLILRRCIDRFDRGTSTLGFHSSFRIYSCNHVELQNCIAIDAEPEYSLQKLGNGSLIPAGAHFVIWSGGINGPNDDVHIKGTLILNNRLLDGRAYILQNSYQPKNNTITDSVFWGVYNGLWTRLEVPEGTVFDHLTVGDSPGGTGQGEGITGEYGNGVTVKNSIIYGIDAYGIKWTDNPGNTSDYNALYNNSHNYGSGASPKPHDFCSKNSNEINPLTGDPGNGIPALKYLPRIEEGSDLDGAASDGGDIGATILYRIGKPGTLWGEPGYNETTNEFLWPFPNENLIKEQMSCYYFDNLSDNLPPLRGARGFCANGTGLYGGPITLTSYIWEYLGNPCPPEICAYGDNTPTRSDPAPTGILPSGTTTANISLTTNIQATCLYSNVSGINYSDMPFNFTYTNSTNHSTLVTGLENGQTYTFYVKCNSSEGFVNTDDFNISFSVGGHKADLNDDGIISMPELMLFIGRWKAGDGITHAEVLDAQNIWFGGGALR